MSRQPAKTRHLPTRILSGLMRRMRWIGIKVELFLTVREGEEPIDLPESAATFRFAFLDAADIDDLARLEPTIDRHQLTTWFEQSKLCFGVRDGAQLIAKMWCDLDEFNYPPNFRSLDSDEAYLFAAYADPAYRGKSLAPLMRARCYESLREIGRSRFCSYTDYFNTAARRFKRKLGARNEALRLHFELFGRWSKTVTLRTYP